MSGLPENVTLPTGEYLRLLSASLELAELEAAGVDNWINYSEVDWGAVDDAIAGAMAALTRTTGTITPNFEVR